MEKLIKLLEAAEKEAIKNKPDPDKVFDLIKKAKQEALMIKMEFFK